MPSSLVLAALLLGMAGVQKDVKEPVTLVERILAVVDERPLLLSEVRAAEAVRGLGCRAALEAALDERLMYEEAARLPQAEVSDEEVARALGALLETRPGIVERVPRPEIERLLRRQATILKYVEFRFRPQVRITEAELRQAWEAERTEEDSDFAAAAPGLRARLERRAIDRRIEDWVENLRSRADVRYVPPDCEGS